MSSSILRAIVARGGFNPLVDVPGLAFYHDLQTADAAYETLPGNTLATDQNDGIGSVLDLRRYKERGPELVTTPEIQGTPISSPGSTVVDQVYPTGATVEAGKLYELKFSVSDFDGVNSVGVTGGFASPVTGVTRLIADGTAHGLFVALAGGDLSMFTRSGNTARFFGISVREIPGYHAIQDLAAAQPVLNIENGIRSALFDGVDDRLVIPNSKSAFSFLHDGTGGEVHVCCRVQDPATTQYLEGNYPSSSPGHRIQISGGVLRPIIRNEAGAIALPTSAAGTVIAGEVCVLGFSMTSDTVTAFKNAASVATSGLSGVPSSAGSTHDLTLGEFYPGSGSGFTGDVYSFAVVQGTLTDYQRQRLATYMLRRAGV